MPDVSPRLDLPYIAASQAQKHVTHNEALRLLDSVTQLGVKSFDAETPPLGANDGDIYSLGLAPTDDWAGHAGELALSNDGAWSFITPRDGWLAWGESEGALRVLAAGTWQDVSPDQPNLVSLGINTSADLTNRLAIASDASLFTNNGNGHQIKINKATIGDTASVLYQTNWSGRAEIGLTGDDDFHFKVSADGATWNDAITVDKDNGAVAIAGISGRIAVFDTGQSVFIGEGAGENDDLSTNYNVFIGSNTGQFSTTGSFNTALGSDALNGNTSGIRNSAIGYRALFSNTAGIYNTAHGAYSLNSNTSGVRNTASGYKSLYSNSTGVYNTGIGAYAMNSNTTGLNNTAMGYKSLYYNTAGIHNTAHGYEALYSNTTGGQNVATGYRALRDVTDGENNTAVGYNTGRGISTGDNNTIIGSNVIGLPGDLQNTVIVADGAGNQRLSFDSTGVMDYKQSPDAATANPTFSHYITMKLNGASYYIPAHNATF